MYSKSMPNFWWRHVMEHGTRSLLLSWNHNIMQPLISNHCTLEILTPQKWLFGYFEDPWPLLTIQVRSPFHWGGPRSLRVFHFYCRGFSSLLKHRKARYHARRCFTPSRWLPVDAVDSAKHRGQRGQRGPAVLPMCLQCRMLWRQVNRLVPEIEGFLTKKYPQRKFQEGTLWNRSIYPIFNICLCIWKNKKHWNSRSSCAKTLAKFCLCIWWSFLSHLRRFDWILSCVSWGPTFGTLKHLGLKKSSKSHQNFFLLLIPGGK